MDIVPTLGPKHSPSTYFGLFASRIGNSRALSGCPGSFGEADWEQETCTKRCCRAATLGAFAGGSLASGCPGTLSRLVPSFCLLFSTASPHLTQSQLGYSSLSLVPAQPCAPPRFWELEPKAVSILGDVFNLFPSWGRFGRKHLKNWNPSARTLLEAPVSGDFCLASEDSPSARAYTGTAHGSKSMMCIYLGL